MLASVYSYRVMVKSVSSCCVRGRWVLSNPVTFIDFLGKTFISVFEKYLILYNDAYTMIPECLGWILGQTWEELTAQVINLGHFYVFVV